MSNQTKKFNNTGDSNSNSSSKCQLCNYRIYLLLKR